MIDGLFEVINAMTPGFDLRFSRCDPDTSEILLHTSDGEVPLGYISQGMTSSLGWMGPMIQRLCEIHGSAKGPHAILLIDDIDSHLHPAWQQKTRPEPEGELPQRSGDRDDPFAVDGWESQ